MAGHVEEAAETAQLAIDTIDLVASRAPESALRRTFTEWARVQTATEDLDQIVR